MALTRTKRLVTTFGLIFTCLAFVCMVVAFSTPHWLERFPHKRNTKVFVRMGLWEVCFNDWTYYKDYLGKRYNGCWWIFHYEYRPVWHWINPPCFLSSWPFTDSAVMVTMVLIVQMITVPLTLIFIMNAWFLGIQLMITVALILQMITIAFNICYFVGSCPPPKEKRYVLTSSIQNFVAALLITISVCIFGYEADVDRQWLPNPDSNFMSWSFGFCILSGFFSIFAGMCLLTDYLRIGEEAKREARQPAYSVKPNPKY